MTIRQLMAKIAVRGSKVRSIYELLVTNRDWYNYDALREYGFIVDGKLNYEPRRFRDRHRPQQNHTGRQPERTHQEVGGVVEVPLWVSRNVARGR